MGEADANHFRIERRKRNASQPTFRHVTTDRCITGEQIIRCPKKIRWLAKQELVHPRTSARLDSSGNGEYDSQPSGMPLDINFSPNREVDQVVALKQRRGRRSEGMG